MGTIFVTGATGFVGSHLTRRLVEDGYTVKILRREGSKIDAIQDVDVEHIVGSFLDEDFLTEHLRGVDWVFHVAAVSNYWRSDAKTIYRINVDGTRSLLQAAARAKVKRFIFTSSVQAVGYTKNHFPADENTLFNIDPRITPYGHSKFLAEAEVLQAVKRGLDAVIVNPAIVLGPGDLNEISGSLITEVARGKLFARTMHGGTNFIDVRDVAAGHIAAAEKGRTGERYILGAVNMSHKAFQRLVCEVVGVRTPKLLIPGFVMPVAAVVVDALRRVGVSIPVEGNQLLLSRYDLYVDASKMWDELHKPQIDIRQSVEDTYQWYKAHGFI